MSEAGEGTAAFGPVQGAERIRSIDVLRGVAVLGILTMNVVAFGLPHGAYDDPLVAGGATGADLAAWAVNLVLFDGKMRAIFSMLFGAGLLLFTGRGEARGEGALAADLYARRNLWLIAFGVVNAYVLLWPGDILYAYGLSGLLLFPLRRLQPRTLILAGLFLFAVLSLKLSLRGFEVLDKRDAAWGAEQAAAQGHPLDAAQRAAREAWEAERAQLRARPSEVEEEVGRMLRGYRQVFRALVAINVSMQSRFFYLWTFWDVMGMMLIGIALMKLGVFSAARRPAFYRRLALYGYGLGLPVNLAACADHVVHGFDPVRFPFVAAATYDLGRLSLALAYTATVMLIVQSGRLAGLAARLAAVGQMALSNYLSQSVFCGLLFTGAGFGLYGALARAELYGVVVLVWLFQLSFSPLWLRHFRFGPVEWAWRSLTHARVQPFRRGEPLCSPVLQAPAVA